MPKLTDTQAILLSTAAAHADLRVLPAPDALEAKGPALDRSLRALLRRGLIVEGAGEGERTARGGARAGAGNEEGGSFIITPAGLAAIGVEPPELGATAPVLGSSAAEAPEAAEPGRPRGKLALLLDAVAAPGGATIEDLTQVSGWLPHTTRAALTRLRQRGHPISLATVSGRKAYRLGETA